MAYRVKNILSNETTIVNSLREVSEMIEISHIVISTKMNENNGGYRKNEWVVSIDECDTNEFGDNIIYIVKNTKTKEIFKYKKINDVARKTRIYKCDEVRSTLKKDGIYFDGKWEISLGKMNILEKSYTIEGSMANVLEELSIFDKIIDEGEQKKKIFEWKVKESFKDKELLSEIEDARKWREHCKKCCQLSKDGTTYIPYSLIKEFPQLENYTLPKSMSF